MSRPKNANVEEGTSCLDGCALIDVSGLVAKDYYAAEGTETALLALKRLASAQGLAYDEEPSDEPDLGPALFILKSK